MDQDFGDALVTAMNEALAIAKGEIEPTVRHVVTVLPDIDVRALRAQMGLTRAEFGRRFHFPPRTVQEWEQGRRKPDQAARAYLTVIARNPEAVEAALSTP